MMRRKLLIVFGVALLVRAIYSCLVWTPVMRSPEESMLFMYLRSSYLIAAGLGHSQAIPGSPAYHDIEHLREIAESGQLVVSTSAAERIDSRGLYTETLHPPGWALVGAATHRVFKTPIWLNMQILGVLLDSVACVLLYTLVSSLLGSPIIALISALVYAAFPPLAYASAGLEPIGLMSFFTVSATLAVVQGHKSAKVARRWAYFLLAGTLIGLGSYFRPDVLLLGLFFGLAMIWVQQRFWRPLGAGILMLAASLAVLTPWAAYTQAHIGKPVFTSTALGVNLVNGLGEYPNPWQIGGSDVDRIKDAMEAGFPHAFVPEADPFFRRMFLEKVAEDPQAVATILVKRVIYEVLATPYDWGFSIERKHGLTTIRSQGRLLANAPYILQKYWFRLVSAGFMLICLVGSVFLFWRKRGDVPLVAVLIVVPIYYAASHLPIHMEPRYLLPGSFALFVGFAFLIEQITHLYVNRRSLTEPSVAI